MKTYPERHDVNVDGGHILSTYNAELPLDLCMKAIGYTVGSPITRNSWEENTQIQIHFWIAKARWLKKWRIMGISMQFD